MNFDADAISRRVVATYDSYGRQSAPSTTWPTRTFPWSDCPSWAATSARSSR